MFLSIKHFGILKEVDLELKKITVITGLNDVGKSSIAKLLFSLIKADNLSERNIEDYIKQRKSKIIEQLKGLISQKNVSLVKSLDKSFQIERLKKIFRDDYIIISLLDELKLFQDPNKAIEERRNRKFFRILTYNFGTNLNPFLREGFIFAIFSEKKEKLYQVSLVGKKLRVIDFLPKEGQKKIKPIRDVTYIETPLLMNIAEFLKEIREKNCETKAPFPFVFQDLARKILSKDKPIPQNIMNILQDISQIIKGNFLLESGLFFERKGQRFNAVGVASGIKSFGILIRLVQTKAVQGGRDFLIVDEPEVHLHPEWQIKYADILINLVKSIGFNVIVSTHSPYIVQAFAKLGNKYNLDKDINFYLIDNGKSYLMNHKLHEIFQILGEPLWKVM